MSAGLHAPRTCRRHISWLIKEEVAPKCRQCRPQVAHGMLKLPTSATSAAAKLAWRQVPLSWKLHLLAALLSTRFAMSAPSCPQPCTPGRTAAASGLRGGRLAKKNGEREGESARPQRTQRAAFSLFAPSGAAAAATAPLPCRAAASSACSALLASRASRSFSLSTCKKDGCTGAVAHVGWEAQVGREQPIQPQPGTQQQTQGHGQRARLLVAGGATGHPCPHPCRQL